MKTKKSLLALLLLAAISMSMFLGCGSHYDDGINWDGDAGGTLEIFNGSNKDIVAFIGGIPDPKTFVGGIKAGKTTPFDPGKHVGEYEYGVGGYTVVRGITKEQYEKNITDLSKAKVDFMAMATYRKGTTYRIQIDNAFMGEYGVRFVNRGRIGMELRANSPEGEKISYLPAFQQNQMVYFASPDAVTVFPVYVFYNKKTGEVTTLKTTSLFGTTTVSPRPLTDETSIQTYPFPTKETSWEAIVGTLKSPAAYITVRNYVMGQSLYFTVSGTTRLYSQNGFNSVGSGELNPPVFEVPAADEEDGGIPIKLVVQLYGGLIEVAVLFEGEETPPVIKNGYNYIVTVDGSGQDSFGYTAKIKEVNKRDLIAELESL